MQRRWWCVWCLAMVALPASAVAQAEGSDSAAPAEPQPGTEKTEPATQGEDSPLPPPARTNRFALSFDFGGGWVDLERFHEVADSVDPDAPRGNQHIAAAFSFRYYAPYYVLAQVGYGAVYNWANGEISTGTKLENDNVVMEIPILVGGYYPVHDRINAYGALGPSGFFFAKSYWDSDRMPFNDFEADGGVGFHMLVGSDFFVAQNFAFGVELHYRMFKAEKLEDQDTGARLEDSSGDPYDLDFQSVSLMLNFRVFFI